MGWAGGVAQGLVLTVLRRGAPLIGIFPIGRADPLGRGSGRLPTSANLERAPRAGERVVADARTWVRASCSNAASSRRRSRGLMVPAGAERRGRLHCPSLAARGTAAARAPWRGPGCGNPGPGAEGGSSAAPSRALGAGSAAQRGGGRRSGTGRRPVAGTAGGGDDGGGRGPGRGWRARGSCDLNTRSPPGHRQRRGGGGADPLQTLPPATARERGRTALEAGLRGSPAHQGSGEMCDLKDRNRQESENEFIACIEKNCSPGPAA